MRLPFHPLAILAGLSATVKVVEAGHYARGVEALFMYTAYRMDVELSSAKAIADGTWDPNDPDAEKPWKLARDVPDDDAHTTESDWDQPRDRSKYGHNFHSFIRQTQGKSSRYPQSGAGFDDVADRWNPDIESVKRMAEWGAPTSGGGNMDPSQKYPYNGFDLRKLLGGCCDGNAGSNRDDYFRFHNILSIVGYRVKELYEQNPTAGQPYYEKMRKCLLNAHIARTFESEEFKIKGIRKVFSKINNVSVKWVISDPDKLVREHVNGADTDDSIWRGEKDTIKEALNTDATKDMIKDSLKGNKPLAKSTIATLKDVSKNWGSAKASDSSQVWGDEQTVLHEKVRQQTYVLRKAMKNQLKNTDGSSEGCGFTAPSLPSGN